MHRNPGFLPDNPGFPNFSDQHDIAVIDFAERDATPADLWTFTPAGEISMRPPPHSIEQVPTVTGGPGAPLPERILQ